MQYWARELASNHTLIQNTIKTKHCTYKQQLNTNILVKQKYNIWNFVMWKPTY